MKTLKLTFALLFLCVAAFSQCTPITYCQAITSPGTYCVTQDLAASTWGQKCITVSGTSNVSINCQNHTITGDMNQAQVPLVKFDNVNSSYIANCTLNVANAVKGIQSLAISGSTPVAVNITTTADVAIAGNTAIIANSHINGGTIWVSGDNYSVIGNTVTKPTKSTMDQALIYVNYPGTGGVIQYNTLDGGFDGTPSHPSTDDGIVMTGQTAAEIAYNTIKNVYDCGIENYGKFDSSSVHDNNFVGYFGRCMIGGWYWSSLNYTGFRNNHFTPYATQYNQPPMFDFSFADSPGYPPPPGDYSTIYFRNNVFEGNTWTKAPGSSYSYDVIFDLTTIPSSLNKSVYNNIFRNNDFGKPSYGTQFGIAVPAGVGAYSGVGNTCLIDWLGVYPPFACN